VGDDLWRSRGDPYTIRIAARVVDIRPSFPSLSMLPRTVVPLSVAWLAALALATPPLVGGCSARSDALSGTGTPTIVTVYEPDAADAGVVPEPANLAPAVEPFQGNLLCQVSWYSSCQPDDVVNTMCDPVADGGATDAGDAQAPSGTACHVVASDAGALTACLQAGFGMNSSSCTEATDCAAGHECVGDGTCRHYCCGGNSACSLNQFCDVQPTFQAPATLVPVCMPQIPCTLLDDDSCPTNQQCGVVRDDGATSCLAVGTAGDREPCDEEHCAHGLVCLGAVGSRRCAPLCYTAIPTACNGSGRTCTGALPLFPNATIGACQ
jgi:hypothetical protein